MRINKVQFAGLAAVLAGAGAGNAEANDVTVSTATTTPLQTSAPDNVSPGDVTITNTGSIAVTAGQTAVTVNSNNDVSNAGSLTSNDANNTTGILLQGGFVGPQPITNNGTISLLETYTLADTDNDGDRDGVWATGTNRHGIRLQAGAAFNGDITSSGVISVEGNNSYGIRLDAQLNGDLTNSGSITLVGDNSAAIAVLGGAAGGVSSDIFARGSYSVTGQNSSGLIVGAPVGGQVRVNGAWTATGYHSVQRPANTANLDADDLLQGGSALDIRFSVAGGVTVEGIGVEDDLDDDGDGIAENAATPDANDDATASINVFGGAPAVRIQADPSANLALGATASGFGLHVRGAVAAHGIYDNVDATAIRIAGSGVGQTTTVTGGVALDGDITTTASEANAHGLFVGPATTIPSLLIRRRVFTSVNSEAADDSVGIYIAAGANLASLNNSGTLTAQMNGEAGDATAILDLSNTLTAITNSGSITALVNATDADPNDNTPPPPVTGAATAIDVSASSAAVTINQIADVVFNDDDTVDNDVASRPAVQIVGAIRLGSGADVVNLAAGLIDGDISFGTGADSFTVSNGAQYAGRLSDADGLLTLNLSNGRVALEGGTLNLGNATFGDGLAVTGDDAVLSVLLSTTLSESTLIAASGSVAFGTDARIDLVAPSGLPISGSHTFLTAASLTGAANVERSFSGAGSPWLYNFQIAAVGNSLVASYLLKTPGQLNLNANQSLAFTPLINAIRPNAAASAALAALDSQADFIDAYQDLMPSYASASAELATTAIQQSQGATSNRLANTRLQGIDDVSLWAQEIGYSLTRTPATVNGQEYTGQGFGFALGIDGPLENGALFGLSAAFLASQAEEDGRPEGEISSSFGQVNAYLGAAFGPIDLDLIAGAGAGKMSSRRAVEIGAGFSARSEAEWWAYEGHASVRASAPLRLAEWMIVTPQVGLTYVALSESSYEETGGGVGIDYEADDAMSQRLWADVGLEISGRFSTGGGGQIAPRLYAGYRSNAIDEATERTFRFASAAADFTLADESVGDGGPLVGLGVDASNGYSTISLSYEGELGDQIERHSINAAVRFRF